MINNIVYRWNRTVVHILSIELSFEIKKKWRSLSKVRYLKSFLHLNKNGRASLYGKDFILPRQNVNFPEMSLFKIKRL